MLNYTKGEWKVVIPEIQPQKLIIDCELPEEDGRRYHRSICRMFGYCDTKEEEFANARLIAQAPAMYEALKITARFFITLQQVRPALFDNTDVGMLDNTIKSILATIEGETK